MFDVFPAVASSTVITARPNVLADKDYRTTHTSILSDVRVKSSYLITNENETDLQWTAAFHHRIFIRFLKTPVAHGVQSEVCTKSLALFSKHNHSAGRVLATQYHLTSLIAV
jgi:hypothetical protein